MALYQKVRGTIEALFQLGLSGPQLKAVAGPPVAVEHRDSADAAYVIARAAPPNSGIGAGSDADLVTQRADQQNFHRTFLLMGG